MHKPPFTPALSQTELAEMIDIEGLDFQFRYPHSNRWEKSSEWKGTPAIEFVEKGYPILLTPGALTEFGLKPGMIPRNPDNLPPEEITEGGKYRAITEGDWDEEDILPPTAEVYREDKQLWMGPFKYVSFFHEIITYRLPINTPFHNSAKPD